MKSYVALFICLSSLTVAAQQPATQKAPPPTAAPAQPATASTPAPPAPPVSDEGKPINIRLDVSVIDQIGAGLPQPKSLMVILRERAPGRTRSAFEDRWISVDARPILVDGRIRVDLTIQSDAAAPATKDQILSWRNGFSLLLDNGKPMIALETMDAVTKRKLSIEVKATIQK